MYEEIYNVPLLQPKQLLQNSVSVSATARAGLRSAAFKTVAVPRTMSSLGDRLFAVAGPRAWNKLPLLPRCVHSVAAFKRQLKTFLYNHAFN